MTANERAKKFIDDETQFQLGFLPTEQSNSLTASMQNDFEISTVTGIATLQRPDRSVAEAIGRILASKEFASMTDAFVRVLKSTSGRIIFSGCGATGRLSILLETIWKGFFRNTDTVDSLGKRKFAEKVESMMTGGDFALIKSVESFEDYSSAGARQVQDMGVSDADVFVAITEGGETSSVLGSVGAAADAGATCFLLFNNPKDLIREKLERCRKAIDDPRITILDLFCGPMALAGSTRMQATTIEQLTASAALETALVRVVPSAFEIPLKQMSSAFSSLLDSLESVVVREGLALMIEFEHKIYSHKGKITYFADDCAIDLFTDTTERSPTFMLPPFRSADETTSAQSWAFVKNSKLATPECWRNMLLREPRCIEWSSDDYREMGFPKQIVNSPPKIGFDALMRYQIGNEPSLMRADAIQVSFIPGTNCGLAFETPGCRFDIPVVWASSALGIFRRLAVKLALNTISTGTMAKCGRIAGNWMSYVSVSNKKLLDRGVRLVSELSGISYDEACKAVFQAIDQIESKDWGLVDKPSPVQFALKEKKNERKK